MKTKVTQKEKLLILLSRGCGATNGELNRVCFRYGARIKELRDGGFQILSEVIDPHHGLWRYKLIFDPRKK